MTPAPTRGPAWYLRRLTRMSPAEIVSRAGDAARHTTWAASRVRPGDLDRRTGERPWSVRPRGLLSPLRPPTPLPPGSAPLVPDAARDLVVAAADRILSGEWTSFGVVRTDSADPDWFLDPLSGRRAPQDAYCFRIDHRNEAVTGNVKQVWEMSRHHHLTVLAAAWWLTREERYAAAAVCQLHDWMRANPFLSGIHWTSGIELGVRLIAWVWVRRLLEDWPPVRDHFEDDELTRRQLWWHQRWLAAYRSTGSSANNHLVAEQAGRLVAACAFPWFPESGRWRVDASRRLARALRDNLFDCGLDRELATDYHRFVLELGLIAAVEAEAAGYPLDGAARDLLVAAVDVAAALPDATGRPPRQGDGDEGRALVLDGGDASPSELWAGALAAGAAYAGGLDWWPATTPNALSVALGALMNRASSGGAGAPPRPTPRPAARPDVLAEAGMALLRTDPADGGPEIWVRCDGGPHGFGSMAAHAHADALSVEVRVGGVDVLADPGTYCYHGEPAWRSYFRSTAAHATVEVDGRDQSTAGGPFLWTRAAVSGVDEVRDDGRRHVWAAHHDGYAGLRHHRTVTLDRGAREVTLTDLLIVDGGDGHGIRLMLPLGPEVDVVLDGAGSGTRAVLSWPGGHATLALADGLAWSAHRGETGPPLGWYSPRFGVRVPSTVLVGAGVVRERRELVTTMALTNAASPAVHATAGTAQCHG